jgi:hypothetical protein
MRQKRFCHLQRIYVRKNFKQNEIAKNLALCNPILGVRLCAQDGGFLPKQKAPPVVVNGGMQGVPRGKALGPFLRLFFAARQRIGMKCSRTRAEGAV